MHEINRIGSDVAKLWFQVNAVTVDRMGAFSRKLACDDVMGLFAGSAPYELAMDAKVLAYY